MSQAIKCDRCKKCFDPLEMGDKNQMTTFFKYIFQTSSEYSMLDSDFKAGLYGAEFKNINLCSECTLKFKSFMRAFEE